MRVVLKSVSLLANKFLVALFFFFLGRRLGVDAFGQLGFVLAFASFFSVLLDLGLPLAAAREIGRGEPGIETVRELVALKVVLLPACVALGIAVALAVGIRGPALGWIALAVTGTGMGSLLEFLFALFRGIGRVEVESIGSFAQKLLFVSSGVAAVLGGYGVAGALVALLASQAAVFAVVAIAARRRFRLRFWTAPRRLRRHLGFVRAVALPLFLAEAFTLMYFRIDILMLKALRGDAEVGLFTAPHKLIEGLHIVPAALFAALFARLAHLAHRRPEELAPYAERLWGMLWGLGLACLALGFGWADVAVTLTFGERFAASAAPLRWLCVALALMYPNYLLTQLMVVRGMGATYARIAGICAAANIGANLLLIPPLGSAGAAVATAGTEALLCALALRALRFPRTRGAWLRPLPSAALAAAALGLALALRPLGDPPAAALSLAFGLAAVASSRPIRSLRRAAWADAAASPPDLSADGSR